MIAVLKYSAGNVQSVVNSVKRLGFESIVTDDPEEIKSSEKVIIPGVGEAASAMKYIMEHGLDNIITGLRQPVFGICLGLQLLCSYSDEGNVKCIGIFDVPVKKLPPLDKVPHMGWDNFSGLKGDLFKGIRPEDDVYYVHSYYAEINKYTSATCNYILPFSAAIQKDNFYAVQFHPEKSAAIGDKIMKNFLEL